MIHKKTIVLATVFAILVLVSGCGGRETQQQEEAITVLITKAQAMPFRQYLDLNGQIAGRNEVRVFSDVSGRIARILVQEGTRVSKDSIIAYVDRAQVGAEFALAPVRAPISGYITTISAVPGQLISPGSVPIASIGSITEMDVIISLPERFIQQVEIGQSVSIRVAAHPNEQFTATIYRKDLTVDPLSRTRTVRARIHNPQGKLLSGMFADVSILVRETRRSIVIPLSALVEIENEQYAVYIHQSNIAVLRPVTVAFTYRDNVAIGSGITPDEEVVIYGKEFLRDGTPIYPVAQ